MNENETRELVSKVTSAERQLCEIHMSPAMSGPATLTAAPGLPMRAACFPKRSNLIPGTLPSLLNGI